MKLQLNCIVDTAPRFYVELVLWALCVRRYIADENVGSVVWFVGSTPLDLKKWLDELGIETRQTETLIAASPHCNKIIPFLSGSQTEQIAVSDADMFFVDNPRPFLTGNAFRAPPNNHCNPPPAIWHAVLAASGIGRPYRPGIALFPGQGGMRETHINNICGSLISIPCPDDGQFGRLWLKWANWLIANRKLMGQWAVHVDQMSFALALEELGEDVHFLPPQLNTILDSFKEIETPYAFHLTTGHIPQYPKVFNADRTLASSGLSEPMAARVKRLNEVIREATAHIKSLPTTKDHFDKFLNPAWKR